MKWYFWIGIALSILVVTGCGKVKPPMDKQQMINILQDVHIAEALINGHHPSNMKDTLEQRYLAQVFDKWNTTAAEFEAAMNHMHGDPDYMRDVYEGLKDQVNDYSERLGEEADLEREESGKGTKKPKF